MSETTNIIEANMCLAALGAAWRSDWGDFDGRTLVCELSDISKVLAGDMSYLEFCDKNDIDLKTHNWTHD